MFYLLVNMYVLVLVCLLLVKRVMLSVEINLSEMSNEYLGLRQLKSLRNLEQLNLTDSYFNSLENYQADADPATEIDYPWIARVVHSRSQNIPHVCTAVCIEPAIFITAARCIFTLKVNITSIIYKSKRLHALAFVLPDDKTKQGFDDIGFIVVRSKNVKGEWSTIKPFNTKRTDNSFIWFAKFSDSNIKSKVVGYAAKKWVFEDKLGQSGSFHLTENRSQSNTTHRGLHKFWIPEKVFNLTSLDIVIGSDICPRILTDRQVFKAFTVPCYYSCTIDQLLNHNEICKKYHGVEGGAVYDTISKKLIGVATWGPHTPRLELPVGFAFANSVNFHTDFACARRIREDNERLITTGYYQKLCNS